MRRVRWGFAVWWLVSGPALAGGGLDLDFGNDGVAFVGGSGIVSGNDQFAKALVADPSGAIVVTGSLYGPEGAGPARPLLARFSTDGRLDESFGNGGFAFMEAATGRPYALALHDGGYLLAGESDERFSIWRFDTLGIPDAGFGTGGTGSVLLGGGVAEMLAPLSSGNFVIAGPATGAHYTGFSLARLTSTGALDGSFGDGGFLTPDFTGAENAVDPDVMTLTPDEDLVFAGASGQVLGVFRLAAHGELDTSFGDGGFATVSLGEPEDYVLAEKVLVLPDGAIVVTGYVGPDPWFLWPGRGFVVRLHADGSIDTAFATGGVFESDAERASILSAAVVADDGTLYLAGTKVADRGGWWWGYDAAMLALDASGAPLDTFGDGGYLSPGIMAGPDVDNAFAFDLAWHGPDHLVLLGDAWPDFGGGRYMGVARIGLGDSPGVVGLYPYERSSAEDESVTEIIVNRWGGDLGAVTATLATASGSNTVYAADLEMLDDTVHWAGGEAGPRVFRLRLEADGDPGTFGGDVVFVLQIIEGDAALGDAEITLLIPDDRVLGGETGFVAQQRSGGGALSCLWLGLMVLLRLLSAAAPRGEHRAWRLAGRAGIRR